MRYDPQRGAFKDCPWCGGKRCNQCAIEAEKASKKEFSDGPKPDNPTPADIAVACRALGKEAIEHAIGPDGEGVAEIMRNYEAGRR